METPLTSHRRYGVYRTGLIAAAILILSLVVVAAALIFGIPDAVILLCILLPLILLSALVANLFLWWKHKKAAQQRGLGSDVVSKPSDTDSWLPQFSRRVSTRSSPPPGYRTVASA